MATPTPMKHAASQQGWTPSQQQGRTPSQQGRTPSQMAAATPPVSTPFSNAAHTAFSPNGPRSSPQQFKKSPATNMGMMAHAHNAPMNFDSPSTAAAMGQLGLGGGLDMGLDAVGALGGLGSLTGEDDKLKRLETILDILNKKKGLVSEAGLERLAGRVGLETLSEEQTTDDGRKLKTLIVAGSITSIDIVLENNIVQSVTLGFPDSAESVIKHMDPASDILLRDLQLLPNQSPLTKTLDKFAANLELLAILDKLSILPELDCRQALVGVYESLAKLHRWDTEKLKEEPGMSGKSDEFLKSMAMCSRNGFPAMHARDRVGLSVQYWRERRFVPPSKETATLSEKEKVWSLLVGCAATDGIGLPPIRVSDEWLSKDIAKEDPLEPKKMMLDWQEPPNVSLPPSEDNKDGGVDMLQPDMSVTRVPQVMFTVTFDPPLILPQNDWARVYTYAGNGVPTPFYSPTFDVLFFPIDENMPPDSSAHRIITAERQVRVFDKEHKPCTKSHRNRLFIYKQIYSQVISELPFSHPRQLVEMLPLLRQYAFISILLEKSFRSKNEEAKEDAAQKNETSEEHAALNTQDELLAITGLSDSKSAAPAAPEDAHDLNLDVILWVHPVPHFQVSFPFRDSTVSLTLHILENGVVEITEDNLLSRLEDDEGKGKMPTRAELAKALEHLEDFGAWAEWVRSRYS
ncbi:hypothetical protein NLU13_7404 [Sarocladium strictum]|uniref:Mediator of RNA polymerase II transcription subunit 1 n=1 Tax=Sarocladium strictum TaxID=5046 RepID=A0AA39GCQ6_SARSR|nr:hypothetical protein NLU13_7404 [Sarocladium strictum]